MPTRLAIATYAALPRLHSDDHPLLGALATLGIEPVPCVWTDPAIDWTAFDAVLIRSIWDYFERPEEFTTWLGRLDDAGVPTINDTATLRWNSDKRYLTDLASAGTAVIPTTFAKATEVPDILRAAGSRHVVVKPVIAGGSWHTIHGTAADPEFQRAAAALPGHMTYMIQPFMSEIVTEGEWSVVVIGGAHSHTYLKRPKDGDFRVQTMFGGTEETLDPGPDVISAAIRAAAATERLGMRPPVYARVDGVISGGEFTLMEIELIEPYLNLVARPGAAADLARAVRARVIGD